MADLTVAEDDIDFILRLEIFEQKVTDNKLVYQFYHRNIREFITALFGSESTSAIPQKEAQNRLKDVQLSVFRCILAQLQRGRTKKG